MCYQHQRMMISPHTNLPPLPKTVHCAKPPYPSEQLCGQARPLSCASKHSVVQQRTWVIAAPQRPFSPNLGSVKGRRINHMHLMQCLWWKQGQPSFQTWSISVRLSSRRAGKKGWIWVETPRQGDTGQLHDRTRGIRLRSVSGENMDTGDTISCSGLAKSGLDLDLGMKTMIRSSGHSCSCCCYKGTLAVVTSSRPGGTRLVAPMVAPLVAPGWWQSADDLKRWGRSR